MQTSVWSKHQTEPSVQFEHSGPKCFNDTPPPLLSLLTRWSPIPTACMQTLQDLASDHFLGLISHHLPIITCDLHFSRCNVHFLFLCFSWCCFLCPQRGINTLGRSKPQRRQHSLAQEGPAGHHDSGMCLPPPCRIPPPACCFLFVFCFFSLYPEENQVHLLRSEV